MALQVVEVGAVEGVGDYRPAQYVRTALVRQQWLRERVSIVRLNLYCLSWVCCVLGCGRDSVTVVRRKER